MCKRKIKANVFSGMLMLVLDRIGSLVDYPMYEKQRSFHKLSLLVHRQTEQGMGFAAVRPFGKHFPDLVSPIRPTCHVINRPVPITLKKLESHFGSGQTAGSSARSSSIAPPSLRNHSVTAMIIISFLFPSQFSQSGTECALMQSSSPCGVEV